MAGPMAQQAVRFEQVLVETGRYRVEGRVRIPAEGYRSRLSDRLNEAGRDFLLVEEATVELLDGGDARNYPVVMVARHRIDMIIPLEDPGASDA